MPNRHLSSWILPILLLVLTKATIAQTASEFMPDCGPVEEN
jgi:hypothetical protein